MTLADYRTWFTEVLAPTAPMFRLVPPDRLQFQLTGSSFTLGQLLSHIPLGLSFQAATLRGEPLPVKSMREIFVANRRQPSAGVEEGLALLEQGAASWFGALEEGGEERWAGGIVETVQLGRVPVWRLALFVAEHHIHHLMELHISLKVLGVKVHTGTLYRG